MAFPNDCGNFFDCSDAKNLTLEQALKFLFKADANGCPALNITGAVDTSGTPVVVNRTPNVIQDTSSNTPQPTPINVVSFSILFIGNNGQLNGVPVPNNYQVSFGNGFDAITTAMNYVRPSGVNGRVIITTLV